jgi:hypothetical protein
MSNGLQVFPVAFAAEGIKEYGETIRQVSGLSPDRFGTEHACTYNGVGVLTDKTPHKVWRKRSRADASPTLGSAWRATDESSLHRR